MLVRRYFWLPILLLSAGLLAACAGAEPTLPAGPDAPATTAPGYPARPTVTNEPASEGGYPAAPLPPTLPADYPDREVWILRPFRDQQCTDDGSPPPMTYPDLATAAAALEEAGITVLQSGTVGLMVCEACNCPSSEHYRVSIRAGDLEAAIALGWIRES